MANDLNAFIPEVWSAFAQNARDGSGVVAQLCNKRLESDLSVGDTVHVSTHPSFTVGDAVDDGTENGVQDRTLTDTTLLVNKHKDTTAFYSWKNLRQMKSDSAFMTREQEGMGIAIAEQVDNDIITEGTDNAGQDLGVAGAGVTLALLQTIVQTFDEAKTPATDRMFVVPPAGRADILALSDVTNNTSGSGQGDALLRFAEVGRAGQKQFIANIYGLNIYMSPQIAAEAGSPTSYEALAFHSSALALVQQEEIDFIMEQDARRIGVTVAGHGLYGTKVLRSAEVFKVTL